MHRRTYLDQSCTSPLSVARLTRLAPFGRERTVCVIPTRLLVSGNQLASAGFERRAEPVEWWLDQPTVSRGCSSLLVKSVRSYAKLRKDDLTYSDPATARRFEAVRVI